MLYDRAHGYRDRKTRDEDLVRRFLDSLYDEEARFALDFNRDWVGLLEGRIDRRERDGIWWSEERVGQERDGVGWLIDCTRYGEYPKTIYFCYVKNKVMSAIYKLKQF